MTFEADLTEHLNHATIAALISGRLTPLKLDEGSQLPAATYQSIIVTPASNDDSEDGRLKNIRLQVNVWARTYQKAREVAEAIRERMKTPASNFSSVCINAGSDDYEDDTKRFGVLLEFSVWYRIS